jgi:hypothetical protein
MFLRNVGSCTDYKVLDPRRSKLSFYLVYDNIGFLDVVNTAVSFHMLRGV